MREPGRLNAKPRHRPWRRKLRDRLEYVALVGIAWLLTAIPVVPASAMMGYAWQIVGPFTVRHQRIGRNLSVLMPELTEQERREVEAAQWNNLGRTFAESVRLRPLSTQPQRFEVRVSDELDQKLLRPGTGVVFVSAHLANWETGGYLMQRYGKLMGLYQPLSNPHSDLFMRKARQRALSAQLLPKSPDTSMRVVRWVKSGNCVGMLGDLYERRGSPATFFGKPTLTNPFPAMLARRLDVPLVSVRTIRLPGVRFRLELDEIAVPRTDNVQADIQAATQAMLDQFESWIRLRPGEWMWVQKRWFRNRENRTPMEPAA